MRLTCKRLKDVLSSYRLNDRIYKGHNGFNGRPEVRMDLTGFSKETRKKIKELLYEHAIFIWQDDPLHLPFNYIVTY